MKRNIDTKFQHEKIKWNFHIRGFWSIKDPQLGLINYAQTQRLRPVSSDRCYAPHLLSSKSYCFLLNEHLLRWFDQIPPIKKYEIKEWINIHISKLIKNTPRVWKLNNKPGIHMNWIIENLPVIFNFVRMWIQVQDLAC